MARIIFPFKAKTIVISFFFPTDVPIYHFDHCIILLQTISSLYSSTIWSPKQDMEC